MELIKQYILYLIRWQLSTPILTVVMQLFNSGQGDISESLVPSIVANLIGGLIFFWVDKFIFKEKKEKSSKE